MSRHDAGWRSGLNRGIWGLVALACFGPLLGCEKGGDAGPPGWTAPRSIVVAGEDAQVFSPGPADLAIDAAGAPAIIWYQAFDLHVSRFDYEADDWAPATSPNSFIDDYFDPLIVFDADNDAVAVWEASANDTPPGNQTDIVGAFYDAETGWGFDYYASDRTLLGGTYDPSIAMNAAGEGIMIYREGVTDADVFLGVREDVVAVRYDPTAEPADAWIDRVVLTSPAPEDRIGYGPGYQRVAMDESGNAVTAWTEALESGIEGVSGYSRLHAALFDADSETWSDSQIIDNEVVQYSAQSYWVEMTTDGVAIAVWTERVESSYEFATFAAENSGSGWTDPVLLDDGGGESNSNAYIKADGAGNAMALWKHGAAPEVDCWGSYYDGTTGVWQPAGPIASLPGGVHNGYGTKGHPGAKVAFGPEGDALVVFGNRKAADAPDPDEKYAWSVRWSAATRSWEAPMLIERADAVGDEVSRGVFSPEIAFDGQGDTIAVWLQRSAAPDNKTRLIRP